MAFLGDGYQSLIYIQQVLPSPFPSTIAGVAPAIAGDAAANAANIAAITALTGGPLLTLAAAATATAAAAAAASAAAVGGGVLAPVQAPGFLANYMSAIVFACANLAAEVTGSPVTPGTFGTLFREREVQPFDLDGRGGIDTTTMRNIGFTSEQPKSLVKTGEMTVHGAYDPHAYSVVMGVLNKLSAGVILFPDGQVNAFLGWISKFTPTGLKEGDFPMAEVKIMPSNQNPFDGSTIAPTLA